MKKLSVAFLLGCLAALPAAARTCTWIAGDGSWQSEAAWEEGILPADGDDVVIAGTGEQAAGTIDLGGVTVPAVRSLAFRDAASGAWTLTNGALTNAAPDGLALSNGVATAVRIAASVTGDGRIVKRGAGSLVFASAGTNACALTVAEGTVRLATVGNAVKAVTVDAGATLALDADEQIANGSTLTLNGTFDLNGHSEFVACFGNTPESGVRRDAPTAAIVNTSEDPATLRTNAECPFYGDIRELPGRIELRQQTYLLTTLGTKGRSDPSKITVSASGMLFPYTRGSAVRFVFRGHTNGVQLSEIQLTSGGRPLTSSQVNGAASTASSAATGVKNLFDDRADTVWQGDDTDLEGTSVMIQLYAYAHVDGYRLAAGSNLTRLPTDWDVYIYRADPTGWMRVDSRRNVQIARFAQMPSTNFSFNCLPAPALAETTDVDLGTGSSSVRMRVSATEPFRFGKLTGSSVIRIEDGSTFAAADLTDWTGTFTFSGTASPDGTAHIALSSERGGAAAQTVRATGSDANVTIENDGTAPVSVLIDDTFPTAPLRGRLADGKGPLGLVKRGAGTRTLATANCANTGVTSIEAGTLRVCGTYGPARLARRVRYLRFTPTCVLGGAAYKDVYGYNWGLGDFQLLDAAGERVAWPAGTTASAPWGAHTTATLACLIDGDSTTRTLICNRDKSTTTAELTPVTIDTVTGVTFAGYRWYTANGNSDRARSPTAWTLETSEDGTTWSLVHEGSQAFTSDESTPGAYLRGPFALGGSDGVMPLATLPAYYLVTNGAARLTRAPALRARYFRFQPHAIANPGAGDYAFGWTLSEFALFRNGERVAWPAETTSDLKGATMNLNGGSRREHFCDNVVSNADGSVHRFLCEGLPSYIVVNAHEDLVFDSYGIYAANDCHYRLPTAWSLLVSSNGQQWVTADVQVDQPMSGASAYKLMGTWSVADRYPFLDLTTATDALGDASPVALAAGARLDIDSDYEKFGTLSGAGTLALVAGSVAEVNAVTNGAFAGTVTGAGTLVVSGVATQSFANATLAVANLECAGGVAAGTATRTGDLTLDFTGGAWSGTLAVTGALTAQGTPVFAVPPALAAGGRQTLLSYGSIDVATRTVLESARLTGPVGQGLRPRLRVGETACVLTVMADSLVIIVR